MVALLLDLGWQCDEPDEWVTCAGVRFRMPSTGVYQAGDAVEFPALLKKEVVDSLWKAEGSSHNGGDIKGRPDLEQIQA
eukprot:1998461-Lingulodinium_polyedra.AAC.1